MCSSDLEELTPEEEPEAPRDEEGRDLKDAVRGPDYLKGVSPDALLAHVCESNTQADPNSTTNYRFERAIEKFNEAIDHYTRPAAAAANSNARPAPRKNGTGSKP